MKRIFFFFAFLISIASVSFGATTPAAATATASTTASASTQTADASLSTKDAFMAFILDKAKTYSGKIETGITKAVDFAEQEVPQVVHEFLMWHAWRDGIIVVASILTAAALVFVSFKWFFSDKWMSESDGGTGFLGLICLVAALILLIIAFVDILDLVQIIVAPRVYLIEQAVDFVKSTRQG